MVEKGGVRDRKRAWARAEIVAAAWHIARREGIAALSLRELAASVGMRAPSLYTYFPSKHDLYDAMFAGGMREFAERLSQSPPGRDPAETLRRRVNTWVSVAVEDPLRYELLFQRPIPGFAPSPESLAIGLTALTETRTVAAAAGLGSDAALDLLLATTHGLVQMQIANEPGGARWTSLVDEVIDMLLGHYGAGARSGRARRGR
jgi:AcrR family transcriptional regulator